MAFCTDSSCSIILDSQCVFYEGAALPYTGINTNDSLQTALQKIEGVVAAGIGGGAAVWGDITGTLTNQTDLTTYLAANYVPQARTLTINGTSYDLTANRTWNLDTITASNGLTRVGDDIQFGGTLDAATDLNLGTYRLRIRVDTDNTFQLEGVVSGGGVQLATDPTGNESLILSAFDDTGSQGYVLSFNPTGFNGAAGAIFTDFMSSKAGIKYAASGYVTDARSLTDKAYVDTAIIHTGVQGDILYFNGVNTLANLAKDTNATRYLSNTGGSNNPAWAQINLTNGVTGVLPVTNGGTGLNTIAGLSIWVANTLNTISTLTPAANQSVRINAGGTAWEVFTPSSATPPGTDTQVIFNDGGVYGADASYVWDKTNNRLGIGVTPLANLHIRATSANTVAFRVDEDSGDSYIDCSEVLGSMIINVHGDDVNLISDDTILLTGSGGVSILSDSADVTMEGVTGISITSTGMGSHITLDAGPVSGLVKLPGMATDNTLTNVVVRDGATNGLKLRTVASLLVPATLNLQSTEVGNVGGGEDTIYSYSVPANTLSVNGQAVVFEIAGTIANNANAKRVRIKFGASTVVDTGAAGLPINQGLGWTCRLTIVRTGATTQETYAVFCVDDSGGAGVTMVFNNTAAETLSGAVTLATTAEATSNFDITSLTARTKFDG